MARYSQNRIIEGVYSGEYSKYKLPEELFLYTYENLMSEVKKGFGEDVEFEPGSTREKLFDDFNFNVNTFSGAKTFQEISDMSKFVFDEKGFKISFKQFKELAKPLDDTFNKVWLRTERDTSFGQAQSAESWLQYDAEKEIFPYLKYQTVDDERVRHDHAAWDNLVFPVEHEFWDTRMPLNGYNCRCRVIQLTEGETSSLKGVPKNEEKEFENNAGKTGEIFTSKHPYYKVKKEDLPLTKNNFGLGFVSYNVPKELRKKAEQKE